LLGLALPAAEPAALERMARAVEPLPVLHDGRVKPFASVARHLVLSVSGRSRIPLAEGGNLSASAWLLEGLADPAAATARPLVRLRNPEVAEALGLAITPQLRYTADAVTAGFRSHRLQLDPLFERPKSTLAPAEAQLVELAQNLGLVLDGLSPQGMALVPGPAEARELWLPTLMQGLRQPDAMQTAAIAGWNGILAAVRAGDAAEVERLAAGLVQTLAPAADPARLRAEVTYHRSGVFHTSLAFYLAALLALGVGLVWRWSWCWRFALAAFACGILAHLAGLGLRMWILGRPPVATLYESILFVGVVSALLGLLVEIVRRRGDGLFVGATLAAVLHLVAFGYADDGDTMGMLVAVLNSNFWLTIHVLTITAGYGCCLVAGIAAKVALAARIRYPADAERHRAWDRILLGLALISLLFTLFGTILGGIWADQSWGRFWGWDPKENGALLIVLWLLMLLHLRTAGQAGPAGFALGLVLNNIVVLIAWFGVNLLGVGLHSYGFSGGLVLTLVLVSAAEAALGLGLWGWARSREAAVQPSSSSES
jgi:ABC-type transport system involved in cytochrome c biogenesis permease subunit